MIATFSPKLLAAVLAAAAAMLAGTAHAALEAGVDYAVVPEPDEKPAPDAELSVTEFFNFSCPACNASQPYIDTWLLTIPDNVVWKRQPVQFQQWNGLFARLYFVLEGFGKEEELYREVFRALHRDRKLLNSEGRMVDWLVEDHGFEEEATEQAFDSFTVKTKIKRNNRLRERFGVSSTPTFIIADRYILLRPTGTSNEKLMENITALIDMIRAGEAI